MKTTNPKNLILSLLVSAYVFTLSSCMPEVKKEVKHTGYIGDVWYEEGQMINEKDTIDFFKIYNNSGKNATFAITSMDFNRDGYFDRIDHKKINPLTKDTVYIIPSTISQEQKDSSRKYITRLYDRAIDGIFNAAMESKFFEDVRVIPDSLFEKEQQERNRAVSEREQFDAQMRNYFRLQAGEKIIPLEAPCDTPQPRFPKPN